MGGSNGRLPGDLARVTPEQLAGWWAGPMRAMREQAAGGESATPLTGDPLTDFVRRMSPVWGVHPPDWWRAKFAEWQEEERRGQATARPGGDGGGQPGG